MKINLSKENSKKVLSASKSAANFCQNYLISLNDDSSQSISSKKKFVNALLLILITVPNAITISLIFCTYLLLNAVDIRKNDSKLSKIAKSIARVLIYIVAAVVLIPCIILSLVISTIPLFIFFTINRSNTDQNIDDNQIPEKKVSSAEYDELFKKKIDELGKESQYQIQPTYSQVLASSSRQLLTPQPDVEIISRQIEDREKIDQITTIRNINDQNVQDGKAIIRVTGNDNNVAMVGIFAGNTTSQKQGLEQGLAAGFGLECKIIECGVDFKLGCSVRTGSNTREALESLGQSELVQTMLSDDNGILSIEQPAASTSQKQNK